MSENIKHIGGGAVLPPAKIKRDHLCGNCLYCELEHETSATGACHFNPPSVIMLPQQNPLTKQTMLSIQSFFSPVNRDSWCRYHQAAITIYE